MITRYEKSLHTRYQITNIYYRSARRFLQSYTHTGGGGGHDRDSDRRFLIIVLRELLVPKQAYDG